jgi:hypothetical protein
MIPQAKTRRVTIEVVMRTAAFRRGVADVRAGRSPRFDKQEEGDDWDYERGRQFGVLAPRDMQVVSPLTKQLNPVAVEFYKNHKSDIC